MGAYWSQLYRIFHGYLVISIINVSINLSFFRCTFQDISIVQLIRISFKFNDCANDKVSKNICCTHRCEREKIYVTGKSLEKVKQFSLF